MYILLLSLKMTWQNFAAAKLRTFLTVLGIIIGIASVVIVLSVGTSAQNVLLDQVRQIGSNKIAILPGAAADDGPPAIVFGIVSTTLISSDIVQLRNKSAFPYIENISGYVSTTKVVRYNKENAAYEIQGVEPEAEMVEDIELSSGRFISASENASARRVAVLGADVATTLFDEKSPVGEVIGIGKANYRVIGVAARRGQSFAGNFDESIYVPLLSAQRNILGINYLSFARLSVSDEAKIAETEEAIRSLLKSRHGIPQDEEGDFSVRNIAAAIETLSNITNVMKYFLVTVASIALVVGGIGIMNMMLITLNKRVREIGLRVALGARSRDIALQFLVESIVISVMGGAVGSLIGYGITQVVGLVALQNGIDWRVSNEIDVYALAFGIAGVIGIVFGIYPAIKATRVSPMEALRYE